MQAAPVGDDVFGEDPSINSLEEKTAKMFGFEAGLFCPSGTMTNQLAIKTHTQAGDEVICDEIAHIYQYEGGGIAFNSGCSVRLLHGDRGLLNAAQIQAAINPIDVHKSITSLVSLENTSNRGGGACYDFNTFYEIQKVTKANQLALHLDGARIFNAIVHKKENAADYKYFPDPDLLPVIITDEMINEIAATYPNTVVVRWDQISEGHPEYFAPDGVHLVPAGARAYVAAITNYL
jgi:threonine aldolase